MASSVKSDGDRLEVSKRAISWQKKYSTFNFKKAPLRWLFLGGAFIKYYCFLKRSPAIQFVNSNGLNNI